MESQADTLSDEAPGLRRPGLRRPGRDPALRVLCDRVRLLEQSASLGHHQSDGYLRNRIRELERSERTLLQQLSQLAITTTATTAISGATPHLHWPSMHHTQRLDQRLHTLRDEVRVMSHEKERGERVWRERLQRCQDQLKAKEEEMGRQSRYFHHFKTQLQHKLQLSRDREQVLQSRAHALEKQLLDLTVSAATNTATATAGEEMGEERVPCLLREEGEGEEGGERKKKKGEEDQEEMEKKKRKRWPPPRPGRLLMGACEVRMSMWREREGGEEEEKERGAGEAKLRHFILGLQEDLRALLEREERGLAERRGLSEQLQEAQDGGHLLGCRLEETGAEVRRLQQSESSLLEEVEELREENGRLRQDLRVAQNSPETAAGATGTSLVGNSGEPQSNELLAPANATTATPHLPHRGTAEISLNPKDHHPASAEPDRPLLPQPDTLNLSASLTHKAHPCLGMRRLATETSEVGELNLEEWYSGGTLHLQDSPSEEAQALLEGCRSLGMGEDPDYLHRELGRADQPEGVAGGRGSSRGRKVVKTTLSPPPAVDDLVQALNQENRALAERIQELLAHMDLREDEHAKEAARFTEQGLPAGGGQLTRKTEDDLNTIMELQQRLTNKEESDRQQSSESRTGGCRHDDASAVSIRGSARGQVDELTESVQKLKAEKGELVGSVGSLREEQREVALAVQTQTEEKQRLTRALWVMKEERDGLARSLGALKLEREQLTRTVCGLRDERVQLSRSLDGLREERGQLAQALSELKDERETSSKLPAVEEGERVQIREPLQRSQSDGEQLVQSVCNMNPDRDGLTGSSGCLKEQGDPERKSFYASKEERDDLLQSVRCLKEERQRIEQSITDLKKEEEQVMLLIWSLKEERDVLQAEGATFHDQSQSDGRSQEQHLANINHWEVANKTEKGNLEYVENQDKFAQIQRFGSELCESEARLRDMEKTAAEADREKLRLTDLLKDTRHETDLLTTQVKELQTRVAGLAREKDEALSLKSHMEEQFSILQAELRAKTVALDELNSEYTALRREQGIRGESGAALGSLRTHYNDIRAKYDVLLKKKSQTDLDLAPLKAKLSCLVLKCQERNSLLVHMMRAMRRQGCADHSLTQQAEDLLSDIALQDYTAAFPPAAPDLGLNHHHHHHTSRPASGLASRLRDYGGAASSPDRYFSPSTSPTEFKHRSVFPIPSGSILMHDHDHVSGGRVGTLPGPRLEVLPSAAGAASDRNAVSPVPFLTVHEHAKAKAPPPPVTQILEEEEEEEGTPYSPVASSKSRSPTVPSGTRQAETPLARPGPYHEDVGPARFPRDARLRSAPPPSERRGGVTRRLSSPEKILNLQQQLQQTLSSIYKAPADRGWPVERGRSPQPRRSASVSGSSSPAHHQASLPRNHSLAHHDIHTPSPPPLPNVFSRSAHMAFGADAFTRRPSKTAAGTAAAGLSGSLAAARTDLRSGVKNAAEPRGEPRDAAVSCIRIRRRRRRLRRLFDRATQ
ncbi:hypothetical protein N1851_016567 [Merluccius polli]|uniref:Uncharacterized protein n=1 Tax=Merluccius polli TaxID=89951 RepID=A0AA47P1E0_MERPO|nr:hypothetical protein N1851_016567 [Merluccius polli]